MRTRLQRDEHARWKHRSHRSLMLSTAWLVAMLALAPLRQAFALGLPSPISNITVLEDSATRTIALDGVFSGATSYSITLNSNPSLVDAVIAGTTLTLDYQDNQFGSAAIRVTASDGVGTLVNAFTVTVISVNDAPIANALSVTGTQGGSITASVEGSDVDGPSALSFSIATPPAHGMVGMASSGLFTYTPAVDYSGPDSFVFRAFDGFLFTTATVSITVTPVIEPPSYSLNVVVLGPGSVVSEPAGIDCGADCDESYPAGTVVTLTPRADGTATFVGWTGACSGTGNCSVMMDMAGEVTAKFLLTCSPGSYFNGDACTLADPGYYVPEAGATSQTICPPGYYAPAGSAAPIVCPAGYYAPEGSAAPIVCPAGSYAPAGSGSPVLCPPGYYAPEGSAAPTLCPGGSYAPEGSAAPIACPAGYYAPEGSAAPIVCPAGSYAPAGSASPILCPPGYYAPEGSAAPTLCPSGSYAPEGSAAPTACPAGYYAPEGSAAPVVCPAGSYAPAGSASPVLCPPGYYAPEGSAAPTLCPGGSYAPEGSAAPIACPAGYYAPEGSAAPIVCPAGSYAPAGSALPLPCPGAPAGSGSCSTLIVSVMNTGSGGGAVTSDPLGISCGSECVQFFEPGTLVTLRATPDATSTFLGWTGACSGIGDCVVTMDMAHTVTATFSATDRAPVAVVAVSQDADIDGGGSEILLISVNGVDVLVTLDGTGSYDPDGEPISTHEWYADGPTGLTSIGTGPTLTTRLPIGEYQFHLLARAGSLSSPFQTRAVTVIGIEDAIDSLIARVNASNVRPIEKRVLVRALELSVDLFDAPARPPLRPTPCEAGVQSLRAFKALVRASSAPRLQRLTRVSDELAAEWNYLIDQILASVRCE
jgi:hypothetical protein